MQLTTYNMIIISLTLLLIYATRGLYCHDTVLVRTVSFEVRSNLTFIEKRPMCSSYRALTGVVVELTNGDYGHDVDDADGVIVADAGFAPEADPSESQSTSKASTCTVRTVVRIPFTYRFNS